MSHESLQVQLDCFIEQVHKHYPIEFAYLFGSIATGNANKESDIDIAIMLRKKYGSKEEILLKGNIIDVGMKYFQRKIDIVLLHNSPPLLKYEVVKNGIVLKNSPERATFESLALREYFDFRYYSDIYNAAIIREYKAK